ncbi:MAG: tetratricopeptide repeat protein [bacterium]
MDVRPRELPSRIRLALTFFACVLGWLLSACADEPLRSNLPPSASDLTLLKSDHLCDEKAGFLERHGGRALERVPWGSAEELRIPATRAESGAEESFFFNEEGFLVGALFTYPNGLSLKPYPVLRETLSELKPTVEFYLNVASVADRGNLDSSALYMTGDEKTTTQYLILGEVDSATLFLASSAIDPYHQLLSPYRQEYLTQISKRDQPQGSPQVPKGAEDKESLRALQQFARGETAQLAYCSVRNYEVAADAYRKAIALGFTNKAQLAEAHHKLGLALEGKGQLEQAKAAMLQSLTVQPNRPEVLNNLGTVYAKLGERDKAIAAFEKSVTLRPNYAIARYNLAEASESVNPKRAISDYETYLALVEGIPEEADRAAQARQRVKALSR